MSAREERSAERRAVALAAETVRQSMRISVVEGLFAVQYTMLTGGTLLTTFLLTLGAVEWQIGLVAALPLLGGLLQPGGAEVIRRHGGWRRGVCVAAALTDVALWGGVLGAAVFLKPATALAVVLVILCLQQAAVAFVSVGWTSWISDLIPARLRGRFFGRRNFLCNALGAVTVVAAGQVLRVSGEGRLAPFLWIIGVGVLFRLVSIYYLNRQPEPYPASSEAGGFLQQLREPLAHAGFRRFLGFVMAWGLAVHLASPFFAVYMIREARVGAGTVLLLAGLGTVANLLGQRFWGPLCDRFGDHAVMRTTGLTVVLQPLWWIFTTSTGPGYYLMAVLSITGGFAWSGYALAQGNLMMRLAPETGKTSFFALRAALGGAAGALGPFVGGLAATLLVAYGSPLPGWLFEGLKTLFLGSFLLRLGAWGLLHRVPVPVERPPLRAVYLIRDAVRTFNPTQGFSPLLHVFIPERRRERPGRQETDS